MDSDDELTLHGLASRRGSGTERSCTQSLMTDSPSMSSRGAGRRPRLSQHCSSSEDDREHGAHERTGGASGQAKAPPFGDSMLKRHVRVWWEGERRWFPGEVTRYKRDRGLRVEYADGDMQWYTKAEYEAYVGALEWQWVRPGDGGFDDYREPARLPPIPPLCGSEVGKGCAAPQEMALCYRAADDKPYYKCQGCGDFMWASQAIKQHRSGPLCECGHPSLAIRANGKGIWWVEWV